MERDNKITPLEAVCFLICFGAFAYIVSRAVRFVLPLLGL